MLEDPDGVPIPVVERPQPRLLHPGREHDHPAARRHIKFLTNADDLSSHAELLLVQVYVADGVLGIGQARSGGDRRRGTGRQEHHDTDNQRQHRQNRRGEQQERLYRPAPWASATFGPSGVSTTSRVSWSKLRTVANRVVVVRMNSTTRRISSAWLTRLTPVTVIATRSSRAFSDDQFSRARCERRSQSSASAVPTVLTRTRKSCAPSLRAS